MCCTGASRCSASLPWTRLKALVPQVRNAKTCCLKPAVEATSPSDATGRTGLSRCIICPIWRADRLGTKQTNPVPSNVAGHRIFVPVKSTEGCSVQQQTTSAPHLEAGFPIVKHAGAEDLCGLQPLGSMHLSCYSMARRLQHGGVDVWVGGEGGREGIGGGGAFVPGVQNRQLTRSEFDFPGGWTPPPVSFS